MSFRDPIYVRYKYHGQEYEGEYIPNSDRYDYFSGRVDDDEIIFGYIRPFDRNLRQANIDFNLSHQGLSYVAWMTEEDVVICDAFVTSDRLCKYGSKSLLVSDVEIIEEINLKLSKEEIDLCLKDLVDRQMLFLDGAINSEKSLIKKRKEELSLTSYRRPSGNVKLVFKIGFVLAFFYGIYTGFKESLSLGVLWCVTGYFIASFLELAEPIRRKDMAISLNRIIGKAEDRLAEYKNNKEHMLARLATREPFTCHETESLKYELRGWFKIIHKVFRK